MVLSLRLVVNACESQQPSQAFCEQANLCSRASVGSKHLPLREAVFWAYMALPFRFIFVSSSSNPWTTHIKICVASGGTLTACLVCPALRLASRAGQCSPDWSRQLCISVKLLVSSLQFQAFAVLSFKPGGGLATSLKQALGAVRFT